MEFCKLILYLPWSAMSNWSSFGKTGHDELASIEVRRFVSFINDL